MKGENTLIRYSGRTAAYGATQLVNRYIVLNQRATRFHNANLISRATQPLWPALTEPS